MNRAFDKGLVIGAGLLIALLIVDAALSYKNTRELKSSSRSTSIDCEPCWKHSRVGRYNETASRQVRHAYSASAGISSVSGSAKVSVLTNEWASRSRRVTTPIKRPSSTTGNRRNPYIANIVAADAIESST
jgi:hypothetical protein